MSDLVEDVKNRSIDEVRDEVVSYCHEMYGSGQVNIAVDPSIRKEPMGSGYWVTAEVFVPRRMISAEPAAQTATCDSCKKEYVIDPCVSPNQVLWEICLDSRLADLPWDREDHVVCRGCIITEVLNVASHDQMDFTRIAQLIDELGVLGVLDSYKSDALRADICREFIQKWGTPPQEKTEGDT